MKNAEATTITYSYQEHKNYLNFRDSYTQILRGVNNLTEELTAELKPFIKQFIADMDEKLQQARVALPLLNTGGSLQGKELSYTINWVDSTGWTDTIEGNEERNFFTDDEPMELSEVLDLLTEDELPNNATIYDFTLTFK